MGISVLTAMTIRSRGDDVKCLAGGPSKVNGKYAGWVTLYRGAVYDRELLNTEAVFDTEARAVEAMTKTVKTIRDIPEEDLYPGGDQQHV